MQAAATISRDLTRAMVEVDRRMQNGVGEISHPAFRAIAEDAIEGGKRVRPILTCCACEAAGGNPSDAAAAAAAVELLHVASLLHDDIMDRSELRRGRPTVSAAHGIPAAVMAGDLLLASAFRLIGEGNSLRSAEMTRILLRSFADLCEGQSYDLLPHGGEERIGGRHRKTVAQKTARLLESAAALGAICAGADRGTVEALGSFGLNIGMAYQAQDDLLDFEGDEAVVGKPLRRDERNGTATFLTVAFSTADPVEAIRQEIRSYTEAALGALDVLPPTEAREQLRHLALSLIERRA